MITLQYLECYELRNKTNIKNMEKTQCCDVFVILNNLWAY